MLFPKCPLHFFVDALVEGRALAVSRWGDGEWHSIFGRTSGKNCDFHNYTAPLGHDLKRVLLARPYYILGMQRLALSMFKGRIEEWLQANDLLTLEWIDADVFHNASELGQLEPLFSALKRRPLVLVGPAHLRKLDKYLGYADFVEVPRRNSYASWLAVLAMTEAALTKLPQDAVVSISAGMPGKLLVDRLHARHPAATIIDFGSLWDYYAGVNSRKYMRRMPTLTT